MNKFERAKQEKDGLDVFPALMRAAEVGWESLDDDDLMRLKWYGLYAHNASAPSVAASVDSELSSTTTQPSSVSLASLATIRPFPSGAVYSKPPETIFWPSGQGSVPPST